MSPLPLTTYGGDHATARLTTGANAVTKILATTATVAVLAEIAGTCESARRAIRVLKPRTSINAIKTWVTIRTRPASSKKTNAAESTTLPDTIRKKRMSRLRSRRVMRKIQPGISARTTHRTVSLCGQNNGTYPPTKKNLGMLVTY